MKIGFVTDSTSDLPVDIVQKYGIEVIPAIVVIGDQSYADGEGMSREEFYTRLPAMKYAPSTAAPPIPQFTNRYQKLLDAGCERVISFHPPEGYSGLTNFARSAAQDFNGQVTVIDSGQLSMGLGFQVLAAAEEAAASGDFELVMRAALSARDRAIVFAALDSMEYLRRSGRVGWATALVGSFLRLRPLIKLQDSKVQRIGFTRTFREGYQSMLDLLNENGPFERLSFLHTNALQQASNLRQSFNADLPYMPLVNVTTVIGTHVGPNGIGFAAIRKLA